MKILVVDDEINILELLHFNLQSEGYNVDTAPDGEAALRMFDNNKYDLILLDRMLPGIDGCTVLKRIREKDKDIPVMLLTAKSEEFDKVFGLDAGADDYVTKPFSMAELKARVRALLKRNAKDPVPEEDTFIFNNLLIDYQNYKVYIYNEKVPLTLKEFELLKLLTQNKTKVFSRENILDKIWGYEYYGETRTVDVHIRTLRKKLGEEYGNCIKTVHGVGYGFDSTSD